MATAIPGLHDIHLPDPPGWWPPAPGWWAVTIVVAIAALLIARRILRLHQRSRLQREQLHRIHEALAGFDSAIGRADSSPARLAAASEWLRRAARARYPAAALLDGDAWLGFLDGDDPQKSFSMGPGSLLRDGGFRRALDDDIAATLALARNRFIALLQSDPGERGRA